MKFAPECQELVTINTHKGLYHYSRLPFGVASAPALFQRVMKTVMQGLPRVACYLENDDILITGATFDGHVQTLEKVLQHLQSYGIRVKMAICVFLCDAVEYLGHRIDASELHALASKAEAVTQAPELQDQAELRSFLGLLHFNGKFLPNLSTDLHPLNNLLKADVEWQWSEECSKAFEAAKQLVKPPALAHFDPNVPIRLVGDASAYGLGVVISHVYKDGSERPIAFVCVLCQQLKVTIHS